MTGDARPCILTDYVSLVGTSQDFGLVYSIGAHPKQFARAGLNNMRGLADIFTGGMMSMGDPGGGHRVIAEGMEHMERNTDWANKMMFAAQGIRGLRMNAAGARFRTLIYFTTGYTGAQRAAIEAAGARHASPGRVFAISTSAELINLLNRDRFEGETCDRQILRMDIYSHGIPDDLAFGYQGSNAASQAFRASEAQQLDPERFKPPGQTANIYSWACRTAITMDGSIGGLAQIMADTTGAIVHAYARRTSYAHTWNTGARSAEEAGLVEIAGDSSRVLWHPGGAFSGVVEGDTPAENPSGRMRFAPEESE